MRSWCAIALLLAAPAACSSQPSSGSSSAAETVVATVPAALTLDGRRAELLIPLDPAGRERIARTLSTSATDPRALTVRLEGISWQQSPGLDYEIYVGLASGAVPDAAGPHLVGNLSFYGSRSGTQDHVEELSLLAPLRDLARRGLWKPDGPLSLTFVPGGLVDAGGRPVPPSAPVPPVSIRRVLVIARSDG